MSLIDEVAAGLPGLAQLQALLASGHKPGIARALEFDFVEVGDGVAVFAGTPGDHAYNPIGAASRPLTPRGPACARPTPSTSNHTWIRCDRWHRSGTSSALTGARAGGSHWCRRWAPCTEDTCR